MHLQHPFPAVFLVAVLAAQVKACQGPGLEEPQSQLLSAQIVATRLGAVLAIVVVRVGATHLPAARLGCQSTQAPRLGHMHVPTVARSALGSWCS